MTPARFESRYVRAGARRLHYLDYCKSPDGRAGGRPLLCVHGGAAHAHWFDFVAGALSATHHVLALDLRGHGESDWADASAYRYADYAEDVRLFAESLDLQDFSLVGHSMGGTVSLAYAAMHPGRAGRLVVIDSTLRMTPERVAALRGVGIREGSSYATEAEFIERFRLRPAGSLAGVEVLRHLARYSARHDPDGRWRHRFDRNVYAHREPVDGLRWWSDIRIPALVVKGARSARITEEIMAAVRERCPHVGFVEVPDADHHVTLDNPDGFVRAVGPFLETA